ncbi:MAG: TonB-dependent receptor [Nannocystaceae bacterium]|nr:TonB-dependent receptor [Myxococcales bacterium]
MLAAVCLPGILALAPAPGDIPLEEVPTEETPPPPADEDDDSGGYERDVTVTTDLLGAGKKVDAFRHAGGRSIVDLGDTKDQGYTGVGEALQRTPGVRAVEGGSSGIGSVSTKLNVGVRGANPNLSSTATVMLDEVPIQPAPYGQPELSLFPVSIFSIARVDVVRGGGSVRFGPRTIGGVINLISQPIPKEPTLSTFFQVDHFGDAGLATSYGGTHRKLGMYFEYAPRFGKSFRQHSEFQAHGGLVKLSYPITRKLELLSTTHLFGEHSNLPGGLTVPQYEADRLQSVREHDYFTGFRAGTSLRARWRPKEDHELQTIGFYHHTRRMSVMRSDEDKDLAIPTRNYVPRRYDVLGLEPRYALRVRAKERPLFTDLTFGARVIYEIAVDQRCYDRLTTINRDEGRFELANPELGDCIDALRVAEDPADDTRITVDNDGRYAGYSLFVDDTLYLLDGDLVLYGGVRLEIGNLGVRRNVDRDFEQRVFIAPAPAASIRYSPLDELSLFLGYGRSFGIPSFKIAHASARDMPYQTERADQLELGFKSYELLGLYGETTGYFRYIRNMYDAGELTFDRLGVVYVGGVENDLTWAPGDIWEAVEGLEFNVGHAWTRSQIVRGPAGITGNVLAWYPEHEVWASIDHLFEWGLKLGTDVYWYSPQYTDYANTLRPQDYPDAIANGASVGLIPAYGRWDAHVGVRRAVGPRLATRLEFTLGVKNILNTEYFSRSDDTNGGIFAGRPRTFYVNLGISHSFARRRGKRPSARERFEERAAARANARLHRGISQLPSAVF